MRHQRCVRPKIEFPFCYGFICGMLVQKTCDSLLTVHCCTTKFHSKNSSQIRHIQWDREKNEMQRVRNARRNQIKHKYLHIQLRLVLPKLKQWRRMSNSVLYVFFFGFGSCAHTPNTKIVRNDRHFRRSSFATINIFHWYLLTPVFANIQWNSIVLQRTILFTYVLLLFHFFVSRCPLGRAECFLWTFLIHSLWAPNYDKTRTKSKKIDLSGFKSSSYFNTDQTAANKPINIQIYSPVHD